jgi:hypothetical protein
VTRTLRAVDLETIQALRDRHPGWRLLRAQHAPLVLGFLGGYFIEGNRGPTPAAELAAVLDDQLHALNTADDEANDQELRFPKPPLDYLDDWSSAESGWLRRFYPLGSDEVHYDATPALEKAWAWVTSLQSRAFVGTESRLHTVVDLLRQIVQGTEADPEARLAQLHRQRDVIDQQIRAVEAGDVSILSETGLRDRYQQLSTMARELLSDFREVEENFRRLDRAAREKIASWEGSKGELLAELIDSRADITSSDQGNSFQAFHDFLLSEARQDELSELLARVNSLAPLEVDRRLRTIHHDWSDAAERTQRTVRQISEQLRRFLDDQVWLENRRVLDLVRRVEKVALDCRNAVPDVGLEVDVPGVSISLPFERPLYDASPTARVQSMLAPVEDDDIDDSALFTQTHIDAARLADNIRAVMPERSSALLSDIVALHPVEQGVAEIIGYLALTDDDLDIRLDESEETLIDYQDIQGNPRRVRLPKVTVSRR